jgi:cation-transporting ATPase E
MTRMNTKRFLTLTAIIGLMVALTSVWGYLVSLLTVQEAPSTQASDETAPDLEHFAGLSEDEAAARRSATVVPDPAVARRKVRREIWRTSTFSIFNFNMVGLAAAQALLGDPLSALLTFGVFLLNVGLNAAQQLYATNRVESLLDLAKPQPTVIRDGRIRSAGPDEIVTGDVLIVGPGDEFLVDGEILSGTPTVVEAQVVGDEGRTQVKGKGDRVQAGAICLGGRAVYQVTALSGDLGLRKWTPVPETREALTPLQRIMTRVLRAMLVLILFFLALLLLDMIEFPIMSTIFQDDYREVASGFFSIAPSSLFFMIVATYAIGSARLGDMGALIRESRAVESLAQISVICFSKTGILTGAKVNLDMIFGEEDHLTLAENRVRQILGDLAHTIKSDNIFLQTIAQNFAGSERPAAEVASYQSAYGWSALTFNEADLRGTYVVGDPLTLGSNLIERAPPAEPAADGPAHESVVHKSVGRLTHLFRRSQQNEGEDQRVTGDSPVTDGTAEEQLQRTPQLMLAYLPDPTPLHETDGRAQLPEGLIPLCSLRFDEQIRSEAIETMQAFSQSGIKVKILSADDPLPVLEAAGQLGVIEEGSSENSVVSSSQLALMGRDSLAQAVQESSVYAQLSGEQKGQIVRTLRRQGERVAMVGDAATDIPAMEEADLRITMRSSSQATLGLADIVLLENSFEVLPTVLARGQNIVNGMLDILKINLAQIGYILLLTIIMFLSDRRIFYYHPTQGGVIAFFTIIIPSLGLTFWASSGPLPRQYMRSRLWHFVVPAAITMTLASLVVGWIFGRGLLDIAYSQLAITYLLVTIGLVLVVFVQPPTRFWVGGDVLSGDWRNTYMALVLFLLFILITILPLTQNLFRLTTLQNAGAYVIVGVVAIAWTILVRAIWRAPWLNRYVGILSERLEKR